MADTERFNSPSALDAITFDPAELLRGTPPTQETKGANGSHSVLDDIQVELPPTPEPTLEDKLPDFDSAPYIQRSGLHMTPTEVDTTRHERLVAEEATILAGHAERGVRRTIQLNDEQEFLTEIFKRERGVIETNRLLRKAVAERAPLLDAKYGEIVSAENGLLNDLARKQAEYDVVASVNNHDQKQTIYYQKQVDKLTKEIDEIDERIGYWFQRISQIRQFDRVKNEFPYAVHEEEILAFPKLAPNSEFSLESQQTIRNLSEHNMREALIESIEQVMIPNLDDEKAKANAVLERKQDKHTESQNQEEKTGGQLDELYREVNALSGQLSAHQTDETSILDLRRDLVRRALAIPQIGSQSVAAIAEDMRRQRVAIEDAANRPQRVTVAIDRAGALSMDDVKKGRTPLALLGTIISVDQRTAPTAKLPEEVPPLAGRTHRSGPETTSMVARFKGLSKVIQVELQQRKKSKE